jgi:predicted nucleic acid-binding protein
VVAYLDTSAAAKLVLDEPESEALRAALSFRFLISSELVIAEMLRTVARVNPERAFDAMDWLERIDLIPVAAALLLRAARVPPPRLGTLDAIHLATAVRLHPYCGPLVTYDQRLASAARSAGLEVLTPV